MSNTRSLTPTAARVVEYIDLAGGKTSESNTTIAVSVDASVTAVKDALRVLEDAQVIEVERRRRNHYAGDAAGRTLRLVGGAA